MLLKLKYFFKTNPAIRLADWADYFAEYEKLLDLRGDCLDARRMITGNLYLAFRPSKYISEDEKCCFYEDKYDFHSCFFADKNDDWKCLWPNSCPCKSSNYRYVQQRRAYRSQQEIVNGFWTKRMTERVQGKGAK